VRAETKRSQYGGPPETSGLLEMVYCRVNQCLESDENCAVGLFYEPGCCFGTDCGAAANQSKCGEYCPPPPDSCYLSDPTNATCLQRECYARHQVNGQDTYVIKNTAYAIDCLEVGTAVRPENGQTYKWAIFCGPVITGPVVEENRDLGEYQRGGVPSGGQLLGRRRGPANGPPALPVHSVFRVRLRAVTRSDYPTRPGRAFRRAVVPSRAKMSALTTPAIRATPSLATSRGSARDSTKTPWRPSTRLKSTS
jgi:hypothetical protein